jgi:L-idonate 5-dehydrogenase
LLIASLRRAGAGRIVAADIANLPLQCAKKMGADETINLLTQTDGLAPYAQNKGEFDVMFEASGSDKALRAGLEVVKPRGVLVTVGLGGDIALPMNMIVGKELDLRGTFRFHAEFATAVSFLNQGWKEPGYVISHSMGVHDAVQAFKTASDKGQAMKVHIAFADA